MACKKDLRRLEPSGRARAGSQRQIQSYVNDRCNEFSATLLACLSPPPEPGARLRWVCPLREDSFNEYQDEEFLDKVGLSEHAAALGEFWPKGGPCWDALAVLKGAPARGVVLVEAKSHVGEMSSACKAKSPSSVARIKKALEQAAAALGASMNPSWTEDYYQVANRFAYLYFFREMVRVPAWLVSVYFTDDKRTPTTEARWTTALREVRERMGLEGRKIPFASDLFLDADNT